MATNTLVSFSEQVADLAATGANAVIQVQGARRPASGVIHGNDTIVTTARAIGREDGLRVRPPDADPLEADLVGWDPNTGIAVLRSRTPLGTPAPAIADTEPRAGQLVVAIARSFSNAVTVSAGNVAIVGGPLRTGRRREISRVVRITAPMHDGFAGGGVFDAEGRLTAIATSTTIRGFAVAIPASIAWAAAAQLVSTGTPRRGFVGLAVQPATLAPSQRGEGRDRGLLIVGVTPSSPAEGAGLIVGDVLLDFDGQKTETADDLLDLLTDRRIGQTVKIQTLRGSALREVRLSVAERPR